MHSSYTRADCTASLTEGVIESSNSEYVSEPAGLMRMRTGCSLFCSEGSTSDAYRSTLSPSASEPSRSTRDPRTTRYMKGTGSMFCRTMTGRRESVTTSVDCLLKESNTVR